MRRRFPLAFLACASLITGLISQPARSAEVVPLTLDQTAAEAGAIVVGTPLAARSRWGDESQRWLVTDYTFRVEDAVLADGKARTGATVTLTYWGGTVNGETQGIAGVRPPGVGQRCVLMLRKSWTQPGFTPVVGLVQGQFRVLRDPQSGREYVAEADGAPLAMEAGGRVVRSSGTTAAAPGVSLRDFSGWLRSNLSRIRSLPHRAAAVKSSDPRFMKTFSKTPRLGGRSSFAATGAVGMHSPRSEQEIVGNGVEPDARVMNPGDRTSAVRAAAAPSSGQRGGKYSVFGYAALPIKVNQFPDGVGYSPEDQFQMNKWNYYADIFRVYNQPDNSFGYPDGVFDLTGFPSDATLRQVYGYGWTPDTLGMTFYRQNASGLITEADVALNPAYNWTLDDEAVYNGTANAESFRSTMLHELGHAWGLDHQFNFLSVMNYQPAPYRGTPFPYGDDTDALRQLYPSAAQSRTDLGVYFYYSTGPETWEDSSIPSTATAGGPLSVSRVHIENVGSTDIVRPQVEWYLTTTRSYDAATMYALGATTYGSLAEGGYFDPAAISHTFTVPANVPPGEYYLHAFVRGDGGAPSTVFSYGNNYAFGRRPIRVSSAATAVATLTVTPSTVSAGNAATATLGISSPAGAGGITFTLTSSDPGAASVPASVTIPAGTSAVNFSVTTGAITSARQATLTATGGGYSASAVLTVDPASAVPAAPSNLLAIPYDAYEVDLTWQDNSTNETGFAVQVSFDGVTFEEIGTLGPNTEYTPVSGLEPNTRYWFRVLAYNESGDSPYSNVAVVDTPSDVNLTAPSNLRATALSGRKIRIRWFDNSTGEAEFAVEQSLDAVNFHEIGRVPANSKFANIVGLQNKKTYYYRVRAVGPDGSVSGYTNVAFAKARK